MIAICEKMSGHDRNHAIHAIRCIIESNNHSILQLWQNKESLEQLNIQLGSVMKILTKEHELYASELKEWFVELVNFHADKLKIGITGNIDNVQNVTIWDYKSHTRVQADQKKYQ